MTTIVTNLNDFQVNARVKTGNGLEYVYIAPKGRVTLDDSHTIDANWLVGQTRIKVKTVTAPTVTPTPAVTPSVTPTPTPTAP